MALLDISLFSDTLQIDISITVIYPPQRCDRSPEIPEGPYKVLYLLHGLKQNEQSYVRNSAIERYVRNLPLVVVMPSVGRSFYTDQERGGYPYFTFLTEELPGFLSSVSPSAPNVRIPLSQGCRWVGMEHSRPPSPGQICTARQRV